jgi:hypothetical protein
MRLLDQKVIDRKLKIIDIGSRMEAMNHGISMVAPRKKGSPVESQ